MTIFRLTSPLAGFRPYEARDYQETLPLPPPSTVFGCLLSVLGVDRRVATPYFGTRLGIAGRAGDRSTVLRRMRRDPANPKKGQPRVPAYRPEYQEVLTDVVVWAFVEQGTAERDLAAELEVALAHPETISRFGVVSLGESAFMLDSLAVDQAPDGATVLRPDAEGSLSLTVWVDYQDRSRTRFARFQLARDSQLLRDDAVPIEA